MDQQIMIQSSVPIDQQFSAFELIGKGYVRYRFVANMEPFVLTKAFHRCYGSVYKAVHQKTGQPVALKKMEVMDDDKEEVLKEIDFMQGCKGPNIVDYYSSLIDNNIIWVRIFYKAELLIVELQIAMELCSLGSVREINLMLETKMKEETISFLCLNVLRGLKYLHSQRKIHRDIKTDNILINEKGEPKLGKCILYANLTIIVADFGVSTELKTTMQRRGTVIGTPYFLAPEVVMNEHGYGTKVDIWSLGITVIEMAQKQPPHHTVDPMRVLFMIPNNPPPSLDNPEEWSSSLSDFIAACLVKDPDRRASVDDLLEVIIHVLSF